MFNIQSGLTDAANSPQSRRPETWLQHPDSIITQSSLLRQSHVSLPIIELSSLESQPLRGVESRRKQKLMNQTPLQAKVSRVDSFEHRSLWPSIWILVSKLRFMLDLAKLCIRVHA